MSHVLCGYLFSRASNTIDSFDPFNIFKLIDFLLTPRFSITYVYRDVWHGSCLFGVIAETELAAWRQVIDINLTGTYLGTRAVVPSMRKAGGGAIVNISSTEGMRGNFGIGAYVASKWGARGLTKTAALELGRDNIRVNSIHPGVIRTPMIAGPAAAAFEALVSDLAIPRVAEPEEITRLVLFVASDEASFSTGSEFIADGGLLLGPVPQYERAEAPTRTAA